MLLNVKFICDCPALETFIVGCVVEKAKPGFIESVGSADCWIFISFSSVADFRVSSSL